MFPAPNFTMRMTLLVRKLFCCPLLNTRFFELCLNNSIFSSSDLCMFFQSDPGNPLCSRTNYCRTASIIVLFWLVCREIQELKRFSWNSWLSVRRLTLIVAANKTSWSSSRIIIMKLMKLMKLFADYHHEAHEAHEALRGLSSWSSWSSWSSSRITSWSSSRIIMGLSDNFLSIIFWAVGNIFCDLPVHANLFYFHGFENFKFFYSLVTKWIVFGSILIAFEVCQ